MLISRWIGLGAAVLAVSPVAWAAEKVPYDTPNDQPTRIEKGRFHDPVRLEADGRIIDWGRPGDTVGPGSRTWMATGCATWWSAISAACSTFTAIRARIGPRDTPRR